jgi:hypothetical protein
MSIKLQTGHGFDDPPPQAIKNLVDNRFGVVKVQIGVFCFQVRFKIGEVGFELGCRKYGIDELVPLAKKLT